MKAKKRILLVQLEFPIWERARSWSYAGQLAFEEGFEANGIDFFTLPSFWGLSSSHRASWLSRARDLCRGGRFDQVWAEVVHSELDQSFLGWLSTVAPVRVAYMPESLTYHPEEVADFPHLKERWSEVERRLRSFTHVLAIDEEDASILNARGWIKAMWAPAAVPERFLLQGDLPRPKGSAIFQGCLYGKRSRFFEHPDLKGWLTQPKPAEDGTDYPRLFDRLHQAAFSLLQKGEGADGKALALYLDGLRRIRREVFSLYLGGLQEGSAVVNLPQYGKSYAGRVVEGMAAGRPVISWEIPDRPRNRSLFENGKEILLFPGEDPSLLRAHIERVLQDPAFGRMIAGNALRKVGEFHTIEKRIEQVLHWVESGEEPAFDQTTGFSSRTSSDRQWREEFVAFPSAGDEPKPAANADAANRPASAGIAIGDEADGRTAGFPVQAHFLMIDRCNAKCIMCGGNYFASDGRRRITLEKFKTMAANLRLDRFQGIVLAGAGDPLLNPELIPILRYTNERYPRIRISITTNGIALSEELAGAVLDSRTALFNLSINAGSRSVYRRMMQVDCFDRVCENARRFVRLRKERGGGPALQLSAPINRLNIRDVPSLVELGHELGAEGINLFYTRFYPERIRHLNIDREEDRLHDRDSLFFDQELSDRMVEEAKGLAARYGIVLSHEPLFKGRTGRRSCAWPETELLVGFDGEIYPCGGAEVHFKEKVERGIYDFGNCLTDPIETFWNGEKYRALRLSSHGKGKRPVPECRVCANRMDPNDRNCHLMQWDDPEQAEGKSSKAKTPPARPESRAGKDSLVSVIVPTFNRPEMLVETLRSIQKQTYRHFEVIVINDGGKEVEGVVTDLDLDGRITYVRHGRNRGLAAARNTGIRAARGKYIAYLDDDDLYYPEHLETLVRFLGGSGHRAAYTDAYRAHQKREGGRYVTVRRDLPYSFDFDEERILIENFVPVLCFMHERSCLEETGFFDETLTTQEDWDLWIRLSRRFGVTHIPKVTCEFSWRDDGSTMTARDGIDFIRNRKRIYEKYEDLSKDRPRVVEAREAFFRSFDDLVRNEYDQIQLLIQKNGMEEAVLRLERFLRLVPNHSRAQDDLGVLYFGMGKSKEAMEHLLRAVETDHGNLNALKNLADLSLHLGHREEAFQLYRQVLAGSPQDEEALAGIERISFAGGRQEEAGCIDSKAGEMREPVAGARLVSIIIPVHNQMEYTRRCLESLYAHTDPPFEVIVVDNDSDDGTSKFLEAFSSEEGAGGFRVIRNERNIGFPGAVNQGLARARGDYLLILNNDVVLTPRWLSRMIALAEKKDSIGVVGPMSNHVFGPQRVERIGYDPVSLDGLNPFSEAFARAYEGDAGALWRIVGFCMLIKKGVVEKIGGFDERYGLGHFEDDDFCLRAALAGFEAWIAEDSFVHHFGHRTFLGARIDHDGSLAKNWEVFKKKWGIPPGIGYGESYDLTGLLKKGFLPARDFYPLRPQECDVSQGEDLFAMGDWDGASGIFEKILSFDPNQVEALNNLGVIAFHRGERDRAISYLTEVLRLAPGHPEAAENLALIGPS